MRGILPLPSPITFINGAKKEVSISIYLLSSFSLLYLKCFNTQICVHVLSVTEFLSRVFSTKTIKRRQDEKQTWIHADSLADLPELSPETK